MLIDHIIVFTLQGYKKKKLYIATQGKYACTSSIDWFVVINLYRVQRLFEMRLVLFFRMQKVTCYFFHIRLTQKRWRRWC